MKDKLTREDRKLDRSFNRLVRKAIRKRKKARQPIARYDKERGVWLEYPKVKASPIEIITRIVRCHHV